MYVCGGGQIPVPFSEPLLCWLRGSLSLALSPLGFPPHIHVLALLGPPFPGFPLELQPWGKGERPWEATPVWGLVLPPTLSCLCSPPTAQGLSLYLSRFCFVISWGGGGGVGFTPPAWARRARCGISPSVLPSEATQDEAVPVMLVNIVQVIRGSFQ